MNAIIGGANYMGADLPTIPENSVGGSRWIAETLGQASPILDPQNTVAENTADRIARGVGQGVGYTVAPEAAVAALARGGVLHGRAGEMAGQVFGRGDNLGAVGRNAVAGAGAGAGASIAIEGAPEGWEPVAGMAGGLASPIAEPAILIGLLLPGMREAPEGLLHRLATRAGEDIAAGIIGDVTALRHPVPAA